MPQKTNIRAKRKEWLPVVIACSLLIGTAMWAAALLPSENRAETQARRGEVSSSATTQTTAYARILRVWEGRVALFSSEGTEPLSVYEIVVAALPAEEQQRLQEGIVLKSEEELAELLENYGS